jgi:hypothetical protein
MSVNEDGRLLCLNEKCQALIPADAKAGYECTECGQRHLFLPMDSEGKYIMKGTKK